MVCFYCLIHTPWCVSTVSYTHHGVFLLSHTHTMVCFYCLIHTPWHVSTVSYIMVCFYCLIHHGLIHRPWCVYETMVYETCLYCLIHTPWCLHIHYCLHICTPVTHLVLHYTFCLKLHVLSHLHILSLTYTRHITWNAKRIWYKLVKAVERKHNFKQEFAKIAFTICA